jgi:SAM-dependent methyltransferase
LLASYYDSEAAGYDGTRGGDARADEAATAILRLLPPSVRVVLDVVGMAAIAATRLPGQVILGDAAHLPLAGHSVDAVTAIWLLHLLDATTVAQVIAESARVLRPGGTFIATVDKAQAHYATDDDVAAVLAPVWQATRQPSTDHETRIAELAGAHGLTMTGRTTFTGTGQARSPAGWMDYLRSPTSGWLTRCDKDRVAELRGQLASLPDQHRPRTAPTYRLVAFAG